MGSSLPLRVNEIFYSLQGESTFAGLPCVFIRLAGCSLRCIYCDTRYAEDEEGRVWKLNSILEKIAEFGCPLVEVTGGEPLEAKGTPDLLKALVKNGYSVMLETNGTIPIRDVPREVVVIMDVKCPSSGFADKVHWENLEVLRPKDELKFVLSDEKDYLWAVSILEKYSLNQRHNVLFSPVFPNMKPQLLAEWILRDKLHVRLQLQIHRIVWGNKKRGV